MLALQAISHHQLEVKDVEEDVDLRNVHALGDCGMVAVERISPGGHQLLPG
jgi:hypothetical protein